MDVDRILKVEADLQFAQMQSNDWLEKMRCCVGGWDSLDLPSMDKVSG